MLFRGKSTAQMSMTQSCNTGLSFDQGDNSHLEEKDATILKAGWVSKKNSLVGWKKRFFRCSTTHLKYFESEECEDAKKTVQGKELVEVRSTEGSEHEFSLFTTSKTHRLQVSSKEDRDEWVEALETLIALSSKRARGSTQIDYPETGAQRGPLNRTASAAVLSAGRRGVRSARGVRNLPPRPSTPLSKHTLDNLPKASALISSKQSEWLPVWKAVKDCCYTVKPYKTSGIITKIPTGKTIKGWPVIQVTTKTTGIKQTWLRCKAGWTLLSDNGTEFAVPCLSHNSWASSTGAVLPLHNHYPSDNDEDNDRSVVAQLEANKCISRSELKVLPMIVKVSAEDNDEEKRSSKAEVWMKEAKTENWCCLLSGDTFFLEPRRKEDNEETAKSDKDHSLSSSKPPQPPPPANPPQPPPPANPYPSTSNKNQRGVDSSSTPIPPPPPGKPHPSTSSSGLPPPPRSNEPPLPSTPFSSSNPPPPPPPSAPYPPQHQPSRQHPHPSSSQSPPLPSPPPKPQPLDSKNSVGNPPPTPPPPLRLMSRPPLPSMENNSPVTLLPPPPPPTMSMLQEDLDDIDLDSPPPVPRPPCSSSST